MIPQAYDYCRIIEATNIFHGGWLPFNYDEFLKKSLNGAISLFRINYAVKSM